MIVDGSLDQWLLSLVVVIFAALCGWGVEWYAILWSLLAFFVF